jgi:NDP-sugar pyrophosphorylase family protein
MDERAEDVRPKATGAAAGLRAVILAGGKGARLRPFTVNFPKPLMPLGDTPIVEVLIKRLVTFGVVDITLALGHLAELIKAYFHTHEHLPRSVQLHYVEEDEPTGTAGSLASIAGLRETFLVMNGDLLTDLDFDELVAFHRRRHAALTIAAHRRTVKIDLGVLECDENHRVIGYHEKPEHHYEVSMGVYVYEPRVLGFVAPNTYLDFPDLVLKLIAAGETVCAMPYGGLWLDIGRPEDYARAQEIFQGKPEGDR